MNMITKRLLSFFLASALTFPLTCIVALAEGGDGLVLGESGGCAHIHDESCAYAEAAPCGHIHDDACGWGEDKQSGCGHQHGEDCGYMEAALCGHTHDEACGGLPPVDSGKPDAGAATPTSLPLGYSGSISGTLWLDIFEDAESGAAYGDGLRQPEEQPVAGYTSRLRRTAGIIFPA